MDWLRPAPDKITHETRKLFGAFFHQAEREIRAALPEVWPRLWRYGLTLTRNRDEAEDLAQEAVAQGLAKSAHFAPGTRVDRWLMRILHNLWLNRLRAAKVRRGAGVVDIEDAGLLSPDDPEQTFFGAEVLSAVMGLSDVQRGVVVLVYVEGYSYAEAAEMLNVPIGTIMSRLAAARTTLKERLGDREC
jgi:RNA polymerase sigma-70 factor (ECF subfamily)